MKTITTTTQIAGFTFRIHAEGSTVAKPGKDAPSSPRMAIVVQHVDPSGKAVRVPKKGADKIAQVLALPQFAGVPDLLAAMAVAYEALEFP